MISEMPSRRRFSLVAANGERIKRLSRSETTLNLRTHTEFIVEEKIFSDGDSAELSDCLSDDNSKRRKNGFISQVPYVYAELSKRLSRKKHKKSSKSTNQQILIKMKATENMGDILRHAVRQNNMDKVNRILHQDPTCIDFSNSKGITSLHEAAFDGNLNCIKLLLEKGANICIVDNEGFNCVDYAVLAGHYDCAFHLAQKGAPTTHIRDGLVGL